MTAIRECISNYKSGAGRLINKHLSYISAYEHLLSPFKDRDVILAEIGISHGGSLQMWKEYLGHKAQIYGLDSAEHVFYEEDQIKCFYMNQSKLETIQSIAKLIPKIDILVDDGSHVSLDQIQTFNTLFPNLSEDGLYFVEDTHTSYRELYGGGYLKPGTFIEFCKSLVGSLNRQETEEIPFTHLTDRIRSVSFYPSLVVIRKLGNDY